MPLARFATAPAGCVAAAWPPTPKVGLVFVMAAARGTRWVEAGGGEAPLCSCCVPCCGAGVEHSPDRSHGRGAIASGIFCQPAIASVLVAIHEPPASCTTPIPLACNRSWEWRRAISIMLPELRLKLGDLLLRLRILLQGPIQLSISSLLARHRKLQEVSVERDRTLKVRPPTTGNHNAVGQQLPQCPASTP